MTDLVTQAWRIAPLIAVVGGALALLGWVGPGAVLPVVLMTLGATLLVLAVMLLGAQAWTWRARTRRIDGLAAALAREPAPRLLVDPCDDRIVWRNDAARALAPPDRGDGAAAFLSDWLADPDERVGRLHDRARAAGHVQDIVRTANGELSIAIDALHDDLMLWRLEQRPAEHPVAAPRAATAPEAFESLPVGLVRLGPEGEVRRANQLARQLLGITGPGPERLANLLEGPGRPVNDWLADAWQGRVASAAEIMCVSGAHDERFVQVSLRRTDASGAPELLALVTDATEFKALEDKFTQSQKMHAVGQLAGGVAHDFNNLLTAIGGYCDLLLLRHDRTDPDYPDLVQIQQNANRAASLVRQLLAFSRKQRLDPEVIDLEDTLHDLAHLLNRLLGERVTLTLVHGEGVAPIRADRRQLEQVLLNLVVNARDAMPLGGEIRVETRAVTLDADLQRDRARVPAGDYAQIVIRDQGVGIAPEKLPKIFDPFFTTKRPGEGTGLGLSTAYGIVKQTGGFIFVDSEVGEWTTFTLYFAAHHPALADPDHDAASPVPDSRTALAHTRGVILLVEDEAPVRAFSARALQMQGHEVIEAASGEAALELLDDPGLHIDLFVTDVVMPGLDGPGWVREARKARPDVGVIFVSGYADEAIALAHDAMPNAEFLSKPYTLQQLSETVAARLA